MENRKVAHKPGEGDIGFMRPDATFNTGDRLRDGFINCIHPADEVCKKWTASI